MHTDVGFEPNGPLDAIQAKAGAEENTIGALEAANLLEPFLARDCLARDAGLLLADDAWVAASAR